MSPLFKIVVGAVSFVLGLGYLYRPDLIERLNAVIRETILNDSYIALERRKWGTFFLLVGFLFLYIGFEALLR